jgi:hypothetical protein
MMIDKEKQMQETRAAFARVFVHGDDGRKVLESLRQFAGMNTPGYYPDSDRTAFMAGHRSVILFIEQMATEAEALPKEQEPE